MLKTVRLARLLDEESSRRHEKSGPAMCSLYSPNDLDSGAINYFVTRRDGHSFLLKSCREDRHDRVLKTRISKLNHYAESRLSREAADRIIFGRVRWLAEEDYLYYRFEPYPNLYSILRKRVWLKGPLYSKCVGPVAGFCSRLEAGSTETESRSALEGRLVRYREAYGQGGDLDLDPAALIDAVAALKLTKGLVHMDLAPGNILWTGADIFVVDWEYWDTSLSIFNMFDLLLTFGALYSSPAARRRGAGDYLRIFDLAEKGLPGWIREHLGGYITRFAYDRLTPEDMTRLFILFLMNKATAHFRIYETTNDLDLFWRQVLGGLLERRVKSDRFWRRLLG